MTEKTPCALNKRMVFLHDVSLGGVRGLLALAADLSPCGQFREAGGEIAQSGGDVYVLGQAAAHWPQPIQASGRFTSGSASARMITFTLLASFRSL